MIADPFVPTSDHAKTLADDEMIVTLGASACIDVWMGGDPRWRTEEGGAPSQEFMAGADWQMAVALTRAILGAVLPAVHQAIVPPDSIVLRRGYAPIPRDADEAVGMLLFGERWLRDNAPERLKGGKPEEENA